MNNIKLLTTITIIPFMLSIKGCKTHDNTNVSVITDFPFVQNIVPFQESNDDLLYFTYKGIKIIGNYLAVVESKGDKMLVFIDKDSLTFVCSKIDKGNGPNELLLPGRAQVKGDSLFLLDMVKKELHLYDIKNLIPDGPLPTERIYKIDLINVQDAKHISSNRILASGAVHDGLVAQIDSIGNIRGTYGESLEGCPAGYSNTAHFHTVNMLDIRPIPQSNKFLISSFFSDKLQILNEDNTLELVITGPDFTLPKFYIRGNNLMVDDDSKLGYFDVTVTGKYIYGLYSGYSQNELMKLKHAPNAIFVFTHNGAAVARFNLDRDIKAFDVDENNGIFYAVQLRPVSKIFKYKFELPH